MNYCIWLIAGQHLAKTPALAEFANFQYAPFDRLGIAPPEIVIGDGIVSGEAQCLAGALACNCVLATAPDLSRRCSALQDHRRSAV